MVKNSLLDSERNKKIYKLYTTTNMTALEIATEFELTESSIRRIVRDMKNPVAHKQKAGAAKTAPTKKDQTMSDFVDKAMANRDPKTGERIDTTLIKTDPSSIDKTKVTMNKNDLLKLHDNLMLAKKQINK